MKNSARSDVGNAVRDNNESRKKPTKEGIEHDPFFFFFFLLFSGCVNIS